MKRIVTIICLCVSLANIYAINNYDTNKNETEFDFSNIISSKKYQQESNVDINDSNTTTGEIIFYDSFDKCDGNGGNDNIWNGISSSNGTMTNYTDVEGWTFKNCFVANKCVRFGTSNSSGSATTPTIKVPIGKEIELTFKAAAWDTSKENTDLSISGTGCVLSTSSVTLSKGKWTTYTIVIVPTISEIAITWKATNTTNSRFFLDEIKIQQDSPAILAPTLSVESGSYDYDLDVSLNCKTEGTSIYYTNDGTIPTNQSILYDGNPISISKTTTLNTVAYLGDNYSIVSSAKYTIFVKDPEISPISGEYAIGTKLTISTETEGAIIYYTTDGSTPTPSSNIYTEELSIDESFTLNAIAIRNDICSKIVSAKYTIQEPLPAVPEECYLYETFDKCNQTGGNDGTWNNAGGTNISSSINTYTNSNGWSLTNGYLAYKCLKIGTGSSTGSITTPSLTISHDETPTLSFKVGGWSDKTGTLELNSTNCVLSETKFQIKGGEWREYSVKITDITGDIKIKFASSNESEKRFFIDNIIIIKQEPEHIATPQFSAESDYYDYDLDIYLTCETEGASIYYTIDETDPTTNSILYNGEPIFINSDVLIRAIAVKGELCSEISEEIYFFYVKEPILSITNESWKDNCWNYGCVELTSPTEGATIYYTTDGSEPDIYSEQYFGTITLNERRPTKIGAIAVRNGISSNIVWGTCGVDYPDGPSEVKVPTPSISPNGCTFFAESNLQVEITCDLEGSVIYYTIDGSDPIENGEIYTDPISVAGCFRIGDTNTIKAAALYNNKWSDVAIEEYYYRNTFTPEFSTTQPGEYEEAIMVSFSCSNEDGVKFYYTTDGSKPTKNSQCGSSVYLTRTTTLKVIAVYYDIWESDITQGVFTIHIDTQKEQGDYYFCETFSNVNGTGANDGNWSMLCVEGFDNNYLDYLSDNKGWLTSISDASKGYKCLAFGNIDRQSIAMMPTLGGLEGKEIKLYFWASAFAEDANGTVLVVSTTNCKTSANRFHIESGQWNCYSLTISNIIGDIDISFTTEEGYPTGFFLDDLYIPKDDKTLDYGNINNDKNISVTDITSLINYLSTGDCRNIDKKLSDANQDGEINKKDLEFIIGKILNK